MPCDTQLKPKQTIQQRAEEIRRVVERLSVGLTSGRVKAVVGPQGGITFVGLTEEERNRVTDNCLYRRLLSTGSALARAAIARAEQLAGRTVDRQAVAQGLHSHDGVHWHSKG